MTAADLPAAAAGLELRHGVRPLLPLFDADPDGLAADVRDGRRSATLGLFTPNARFAATDPTLRGTPEGDGVVLRGYVRGTVPDADVVLAAVDVPDGTRLVLLDRAAGEPDGRTVPRAALSRPVSRTGPGPLTDVLERYAWEFARLATTWSGTVLADLRRVLASAGDPAEPLSTSQYLAHELSRLEIEVVLAGIAAGPESGLAAEPAGGPTVAAVLLAAVDTLHRTVAVAEDMAAELGLPLLPGWPGRDVQRWFGGRRRVESALARRMGLVA